MVSPVVVVVDADGGTEVVEQLVRRALRSAVGSGSPRRVSGPTPTGSAAVSVRRKDPHPMSSQPHRSVPGLAEQDAQRLTIVLQDRLVSLIDLQLVLKHVHWNVVGPNFISVHEMVDEQVEAVRDMTDDVAERIATLGASPDGRSGSVVAQRSWDDYPLSRASVFVHLKELDEAFAGVIADHRAAIDTAGELDPITEDMLIGQTAKLELHQWFIRSFVERSGEADGHTEPGSATVAAERRDAHRRADAGSMPSESEEAAADRHADDVDLNAVEKPYREMTRTGAEVRGEGQIV